MFFEDRVDAGRRLAERLRLLRGADIVVLGLPRGGVPVAFEVARRLQAPLDVIVVRKLGVPHQPELAFGAIGEDGVRVINDIVVERAELGAEEMARVEQHERAELDRRAARFRAGRPRTPLTGRTAVIVDDGVATGATARAACRVARAHGAARVVLAIPVAARDALHMLLKEADEVICLGQPMYFYAVGQWYHNFGQTSDEEVVELLHAAQTGARQPKPVTAEDPPPRDEDVRVRAGNVGLAGHLTIPERPIGVVVFVHGSGSSRHSPRNRYVAEVLQRAGLGTLLFDLLTTAEELDRANVFDIDLLAHRLVDVTLWLSRQEHVAGLPIGYFGASTGAAAALSAAADPRVRVGAVVSRGGRPDLAGSALTAVRAPTLLIVGGHDYRVIDLNRQAAKALSCETVLVEVPGATHLFEEPGTLRQAAELARDWFTTHLPTASAAESAGSA
ncbi:phosphoribosyltransferase family protein [Nocardia sp. NBC_01503]|uniref:phosphoribosyltransferase family protein n=1 Tax=Nocardia sp. NBC_01503 TaxID=2975997 RepID=UPI002E7ABAE6|nr:phosphoribosyltransferase family protein [Nocardia sp. NBC_01503]WTL36358.1 phosphoribosyltransferase family protein [Nocardia sp. NBC_01503]